MLRRLPLFLAVCLFTPPLLAQITVSLPASASTTPLDGRVLLMLSDNASAEPRMQINDTPKSQMIFGVTVDGLRPGQPVAITATAAAGYPVRSLTDVPPGDYYVQAVLNVYQTFHRSNGTTVKLAPDRGEGQHWNLAPGNFYSKPVHVRVDPHTKLTVSLTESIPPIAPRPDTKYIRHIRIQSDLLTKFWGTPMYLSAVVLVPEGFDTHRDAHFPIAISHGHFADDIDEFRSSPPDAGLKPDYSDRFHVAGYNHIEQQEAYGEYQKWISPGFPRFLVVNIQHANPFYDDSYAVNSANLGPYGDAIETELLPAIEKQFRGIPDGWAHFLYGGSTGGWESLAAQIFYPADYNGAFVACPDPVDFHAYMAIDLYDQPNAFYLQGAHTQIEQPAMRNYLGQTLISMRNNVAYEAALGDRGRSGEQFDIWQAVYGPVGPDGYPAQIFDKQSGAIDHQVAAYWREHYDLNAILQRDWDKLGPELQGKLYLYVGSADTYFLNDAVYLMQDFLEKTGTPGHGVPYQGEVKYGERAEHCWNGDPTLPNALSRLHYNTMYLPKILDRIAKTAPAGADMSWKY